MNTKNESIPKKKEIFFVQNAIEAITGCVIAPTCCLGEGIVFAGEVLMLISRVQLAGFLDDEFMTEGLSEDVAKVFITWLIERAERLAECEKIRCC